MSIVFIFTEFMLERILKFLYNTAHYLQIKIVAFFKLLIHFFILIFKWLIFEKSSENEKSSWFDTVKTLIYALLLAVFIRSFLYEPFNIPSGSMKPGLLEGDYIFVNKFTYGYSRYSLPLGLPIFKGRIFESEPKRGDVVVFRTPVNTKINFIKRLIGMPGDKIEIKEDGTLFINDKLMPREYKSLYEDRITKETLKKFREKLDNGKAYSVLQKATVPPRNTGVFKVPEGHYFFLGDNRDNSYDSRFKDGAGFVPKENIVGRATVIFLSAKENPLKFWKWGKSIRTERFWKKIK